MWIPRSNGCGRQSIPAESSRRQLPVCHAKRYVPPRRQRKGAADRTPRNKPLEQEPSADGDELLRELNNGGSGLLRDEEEQDWGLDDVAEHARARQQRQQERWGGMAAPAGAVDTPAADEPARRQRRRRGGSELETHGSPLEAGLARVTADVGRGASGGVAWYDSGGGTEAGKAVAGAVSTGDGGAAAESVTQGSSTAVELEASYARRNREIVEALKRQGVAVRVREDQEEDQEEEGGDGEEGGDAGSDGMWAARRDPDLDPDLDPIMSQDDDGFDLDFEVDIAQGDEGRVAQPSGGSAAGGRGSAADWYSSLAAAGFSVRTNATGEVFLERTVRRKKAADPATAPLPARPAAGPVAPTAPTAAAAATTAGTSSRVAGVARGAAFASAATAAADSSAAAPLVPPLEPFGGRPAIADALRVLSTPRQVLDFLELSYPHWAANGYRLAHMQTGRPVAAPSPAEAAHCLRALAIASHRSNSGAWQRFDLAAGRQGQGLAECLRVTPPRLLPEQATQQLSAAYFDVARRYWLEPVAEGIIGDPRVTRRSTAASSSAASAAVADEDATAAATAAAAEAAAAAPTPASSGSTLNDPAYDSLLAKYTALSQRQQQLEMAKAKSKMAQPVLNGHAASPGLTAGAAAAASAAARVQRPAGVAAAMAAAPPAPAPAPPASSPAEDSTAGAGTGGGGGAAAAAAAEVAARRAAKVDCLVSALWGMSNLGGPPYFQAETEALLSILVRCLAAAPAAARSSPAAAAAAGDRPTGLSGWHAGQLMWSLGNSRHWTPRLEDLEGIMLRSGGLAAMAPRDAARVLWGFASLGYQPQRLLLTIRPDWQWHDRLGTPQSEGQEGQGTEGGQARRRAKGTGGGRGARGDVASFSPAQLACVVWSLAVMQQVDTLPFRAAWSQLLHQAAEVPRKDALLVQTWQANLALHLESSASATSSSSSSPSSSFASSSSSSKTSFSSSPPAGLAAAGAAGGKKAEVDWTAAGLAAAASAAAAGASSSSPSSTPLDVASAQALLLRARDVFLASTSGLRRKVQSGYQRQMANSLTALRMLHLLEDNSAGYAVDITLPQLRIAIEADGPTHLSRTPPGVVLGATAMKRRHLQLMGWHVINITYKEWDKLSSESARRAFLQERISAALLDQVKLDEDAEGGEEH